MHQSLYGELEKKYKEVLHSESYIKGLNCRSFENKFEKYSSTQFCVGVGNALDAIRLIFSEIIRDQMEYVVKIVNRFST